MHPKTVWRVNPDGEVRDTYRKLSNVFQMEESAFFTVYAAKTSAKRDESYLNAWKAECKKIAEKIPELPLSNAWVAKTTSALLPKDAVLHFGMVGIDHCWIAFWMLTFLLTTFISYTLVMLIRNKVADMKKLRWIGFD